MCWCIYQCQKSLIIMTILSSACCIITSRYATYKDLYSESWLEQLATSWLPGVPQKCIIKNTDIGKAKRPPLISVTEGRKNQQCITTQNWSVFNFSNRQTLTKFIDELHDRRHASQIIIYNEKPKTEGRKQRLVAGWAWGQQDGVKTHLCRNQRYSFSVVET